MTEQTPNPVTAAEAIAAAIPTAADLAPKPAGAAHPTLPAAAQTSLESELGHVEGALAALFAEAKSVMPADDPYGHARSRAYSDAIGLLKASAKVGHTVAELRGGRRFDHNINVHRSSDEGAGTRRVPQPTTLPEEAEETHDMPEGWYDDSVHLSDGRVFVRGRGWVHPPKESGGSNTPRAVRPEPRVRSV